MDGRTDRGMVICDAITDCIADDGAPRNNVTQYTEQLPLPCHDSTAGCHGDRDSVACRLFHRHDRWCRHRLPPVAVHRTLSMKTPAHQQPTDVTCFSETMKTNNDALMELVG